MQEYVHLVNGDPQDATVCGDSAGAGSIMHHVVQKGGKQDPFFHLALIASPGFTNTLECKDRLEDSFGRFTGGAGCATYNFDCLRRADISKLLQAQPTPGLSFFPAHYGNFVQQPASVELAQGYIESR